MVFVPIIQPQQDIVGASADYDAPPRSSRISGLINNAAATLMESPVGFAVHTAAKFFHDAYNPGPFLTPDEIKDRYPNIIDKYPAGGNEYDVSMDSRWKDAHDEALDTVNLMPPGFTSTAARWAGTIIGAGLSPTSWLGLSLASKATELASKALIGTAITKNLFGRAALRFGFGTAEGEAAIAPLTAGEQEYYRNMNEDAPPLWTQVALAGLAGGVLKTAFGSRTMFDPKTMSHAYETANAQVAAGQKINISPIIQQAQYEASKLWPEGVDEIQNKLDELKKKLPTLPKAKQAALQETIADTELYHDAVSSMPEPPTNEEVANAVKQSLDWKSDLNVDPVAFERAENVLKTPDKSTNERVNELQESLDELDRNNLLDEDTKTFLEDNRAEIDNDRKVSDALKKFRECSLAPAAPEEEEA